MTPVRTEQDILDDIYKCCYELDKRISYGAIDGHWELGRDEYIIENYLYYRTFTLSSEVMYYLYHANHFSYQHEINLLAKYLAYDSSKPKRPYEINSKENNEMFKKLSDTEYENTVAAITDEYEDKKRDAEAEYNEKLAKAEAEKVTANIREEADLWAYDLYARYNALHESGFAEELSIELLKLYISSKK